MIEMESDEQDRLAFPEDVLDEPQGVPEAEENG
jgi:hypothetical protein